MADEDDPPRLKSPLEGSSSRERSASPEKKLSDQQLQLGNHYLIGKQKQILDIETYYEKSESVSFECPFLLVLISLNYSIYSCKYRTSSSTSSETIHQQRDLSKFIE